MGIDSELNPAVGQKPHFTGVDHSITELNEVEDQVLDLWGKGLEAHDSES